MRKLRGGGRGAGENENRMERDLMVCLLGIKVLGIKVINRSNAKNEKKKVEVRRLEPQLPTISN
jgi:hypothetical protein